jgi:hypothetical protein
VCFSFALSVISINFYSTRYYRFFMYHYSLSLRTASFLMVNSTWTKNHVDLILWHSDFLFGLLYLTPPLLVASLFLSNNSPSQSRIVYPPCDTREMECFSLMPRERVILSVAQFRLANLSLVLYCLIVLPGPKKTTKLKSLPSINLFGIILNIH